MIDVAAERIASFFVEENIIRKENKDVYSYGFQLLIATLLNLLTVFIASIFLRRAVETIILMAIFIPLRLAAGGYHAKTHLNCFLIFATVYAFFILLLTFLPKSSYTMFCFVSIIVSDFVIMMLAPVEDRNKPLSVKEKETGKLRSIMLVLFFSVVTLTLSVLIKVNIYIVSVALAMMIVSGAMIAGKIKSLLIKSIGNN